MLSAAPSSSSSIWQWWRGWRRPQTPGPASARSSLLIRRYLWWWSKHVWQSYQTSTGPTSKTSSQSSSSLNWGICEVRSLQKNSQWTWWTWWTCSPESVSYIKTRPSGGRGSQGHRVTWQFYLWGRGRLKLEKNFTWRLQTGEEVFPEYQTWLFKSY